MDKDDLVNVVYLDFRKALTTEKILNNLSQGKIKGLSLITI